MKKLLLAAVFVSSGLAQAQGFVDEPVCYSWNGGNFSAGSFSKCRPAWVAPAPKPRIVVTPVPDPAPVAQSPIMMPMSTPVPKKIVKAKPKPKVICKPV